MAGVLVVLATGCAQGLGVHAGPCPPGVRPLVLPDWRPLFARFADDPSFLNAYMYNGDDLWPKGVSLCSMGRAALLDVAWGPGTSGRLGLVRPSWEAHLEAVSRGRARYVAVWRVVSSWDLAVALGRGNVVYENKARRYRLAVVARLLAQAREYGMDVPEPLLQNALSMVSTGRVRALVARLAARARKAGVLVPTARWLRVWRSLYTTVDGRNLSPSSFLAWYDALPPASPHREGYRTRAATVRCVLHSRQCDEADGVVVQRWRRTLREVEAMMPALLSEARAFVSRIRSIRNGSLLSAALYFHGSPYMMASLSAYTHAGLLARLRGQWILFHRVHGFYYAEDVASLTRTFPVEVVQLKRPRLAYGLVRRRISLPLDIGVTRTDAITMVNLYTALKRSLPQGTSLGPWFVLGASTLMVHLPQNRQLFASLASVRTFRGFEYIDFDLGGLKGHDVDLIVVCSGRRAGRH